jgi:hypothetical protein
MVMTMKGRQVLMMLVLAAASLAVRPALAEQPQDRMRSAVEKMTADPQDRSALIAAMERALAAGVPEEDIEVIVARCRDRAVPANQVRELIAITSGARQRNLPLRGILDRIEQGLSKGVAIERVVAATRRLEDTLADATPVVDRLVVRGLRPSGRREREDAVDSAARALEQSVPAQVIADTGELAIAQGRSMAQFDRSVRSLTFLIGRGIPLDDASKAIRTTIERDFSEKEYARFERDVSAMQHGGSDLNDIVDAAKHGTRAERGRERDDGMSRDRGFGGRDAGSHGGRMR